MDWLEIAGAVFLIWLVLVFLFTPGINYHLSRRTSVHADDFLYTLQSTCQAALHHGNRVTIATNGPQFYAAMLEAEVPTGPVYSIADIARDEQYIARDIFETVDPDDRVQLVPGIQFKRRPRFKRG